MARTIAPYGEWRSPFSADLLVQGARTLLEVNATSTGVYWLELRPSEGGRSVLMYQPRQGKMVEVCPPQWSLRTRVHEYGGGALLATENDCYGVNLKDQQIYLLSETPEPITATESRFADMQIDESLNRIIAVREQHPGGGLEAINDLVSIDITTGHVTPLAAGHDFYASPRLSPDGQKLAWLSWDHPHMPWDSTTLWLGALDEAGQVTHVEQISGGDAESIFQPEWSPDGMLHFVSDRNGYWNLYRVEDELRALRPMEAEFGRAHWVFGQSCYGFSNDETLICTYFEEGVWHLARMNPKTDDWQTIKTAYTTIQQLRVVGDKVYFVGGQPTAPEELVMFEISSGQTTTIRTSSTIELTKKSISVAQPITFETTGAKVAHGYFYSPKNADYDGPSGALPPLLLLSHGGPTSATSPHLNLNLQYFTSRGFAVLDVNYGGSTGYGRAYRERLKGNWGIVDVDDCVAGAMALVERGLVDGSRLAIRGGSAGGFTTLASLVYRDVFHAGSSYYGVSDLTALAHETHKFESRYLDGLVGPYPEAEDTYRARSPMTGIEKLSCPIIFLQGSEDKVVPPNQAEMMVDELKARGLPVAYLRFEGEDHGFRDAKNIKRALESEMYFFGKIFKFVPADAVEPIEIFNADA